MTQRISLNRTKFIFSLDDGTEAELRAPTMDEFVAYQEKLNDYKKECEKQEKPEVFDLVSTKEYFIQLGFPSSQVDALEMQHYKIMLDSIHKKILELSPKGNELKAK